MEQTAESPSKIAGKATMAAIGALGLALAGIVGFTIGVQTEKGKASSAPAATARSATPNGGRGGAFGQGANSVAGQVSRVDGTTVVITAFDGSVVKVNTAGSTIVRKTVQASVNDLAPGDNVSIRGPKSPDGTYAANSITILPPGTTFGNRGTGGGGGAGGFGPGPGGPAGPGGPGGG